MGYFLLICLVIWILRSINLSFILTALMLLLPGSMLIWLLFSGLRALSVKPWVYTVAGIACGLLVGFFTAGTLSAEALAPGFGDNAWDNVAHILTSPPAIIELLSRNLAYYRAGECDLGYLIEEFLLLTPVAIGGVTGAFWTGWLRDAKKFGRGMLACGGFIIGGVICGFIGLLILGILVDSVVNWENTKKMLLVWLGVAVVGFLLLGAGGSDDDMIIIKIFRRH